MKWIHRHILKFLTQSEALTFVALKPEEIPSNLFTYHLNQLIQDGYVKKNGKLYSLTSEGKVFIASNSVSRGKQIRPPRIYVGVYAKSKNGDILLYRWNRQPFLGHIGLPFNRLLLGNSVPKTAAEVLEHKMGLTGALKHRGEMSVIAQNDDAIATHYLIHLFELGSPKGTPTSDKLTGEPFWGKISQCEESEMVYGTKEIAKALERTKDGYFFKEIFVQKPAPK